MVSVCSFEAFMRVLGEKLSGFVRVGAVPGTLFLLDVKRERPGR